MDKHIYEVGDLVHINEDVLTFEENAETTIIKIEEINGNQYLTISLVSLFKVPSFFVKPVNFEIHLQKFRQ